MYDVVIPYLKNNSGELEACIKLIEKNFPRRNIYVIYKHDSPQKGLAPHVDQIMKIKWAIDNLELTDEFYLFNDDFFVMEAVPPTPYYHKGTLDDHIASRPHNDWYTKSLRKTREILAGGLSYEVHFPFLMDKYKTRSLLDLILLNEESPHIRSAYGNIFNVRGEYTEDVKNPKDYKGKTYLSTTEGSFKRKPIGEYIRSQV